MNLNCLKIDVFCLLTNVKQCFFLEKQTNKCAILWEYLFHLVYPYGLTLMIYM